MSDNRGDGLRARPDNGAGTNLENDPDTLPPALDPETGTGVEDPPRTWSGTLLKLGPGLVIAGSIVGSGELIATTKTGAQAGIELLWLVIVGCVIKVFVQIELGRYSITHGQTTLAALNTVPGRVGPVNWILWFWLLMMMASISQLGGIVAGVGQSLAIAFPISGDYRTAIEVPSEKELAWFAEWDDDLNGSREMFLALSGDEQERVRKGHARLAEQLASLGERGDAALADVRAGTSMSDPWTWDDRYWSLAVGLFTVALLYNGRYGVIQNISTALVVAFTFITIGNVVSLQSTEQWSLSGADFVRGLSFQLPPGENRWASLSTALATFGIIGVGATELITYPYWCIEKGYAKFTGKRSSDDAWAVRARGWMRVMHADAFLSMSVYTLATIAFFMMGVTVLNREGRDPEGMRMVSTLAAAYVPVFGEYAKWLFLTGAIAVLYSTFLVANAGHSRMFTDSLKVFGLVSKHDQQVHNRTLSMFCVVLPLTCVALHWSGVDPVSAVLLAGVMQATMLPMLGFAALYFRWTATDSRLKPSPAWDVMLVVSCLGLLIAGGWGIASKLMQ